MPIGWEYREPALPDRVTTSLDHAGFSGDWIIYNPRGQSKYSNEYYGVDFVLEGDSAQSFLSRAKRLGELAFTVRLRHGTDSVSFAFDTISAFDNPVVSHLERCEGS